MGARDRSGVRAIRGPVILITVGLLFVLNNFTQFEIGQTWPVLIIVVGLMSLVGRAVGPPPPPPPPPYPTSGMPMPPSGSYRQTPYIQTNPPANYPTPPAANDPRNNPGGGV